MERVPGAKQRRTLDRRNCGSLQSKAVQEGHATSLKVDYRLFADTLYELLEMTWGYMSKEP